MKYKCNTCKATVDAAIQPRGWVADYPGDLRVWYCPDHEPPKPEPVSFGDERKSRGKQYENHFQEKYDRQYNDKMPGGDILEEMHDKTGQMEKVWAKEGGQYGRSWDPKYGIERVGPRIRSNEEAKKYAALSREILGKKGFVFT